MVNGICGLGEFNNNEDCGKKIIAFDDEEIISKSFRVGSLKQKWVKVETYFKTIEVNGVKHVI